MQQQRVRASEFHDEIAQLGGEEHTGFGCQLFDQPLGIVVREQAQVEMGEGVEEGGAECLGMGVSQGLEEGLGGGDVGHVELTG